MNIEKCSKVRELINDADAILIGAGAGLSASAGIDYSEESFKKLFPELVSNYGMSDMYTSSFYEFDSEEARWSYWAKHINYSFIEPNVLSAYKKLFSIFENKNYFVITTNVDGQFIRAGFDSDKVFEVQGSYGKMQCSKACHNKVYDNTLIVKEMITSDNNLEVDSEIVPKCPVCGKNMDINIRKDELFVESDSWIKLNKSYFEFMNDNVNKNLLLLEFGVGFNTPGIIRYPFDRICASYDNVVLVRVNDLDVDATFEESSDFVAVREDCASFIDSL